MRPEKQIMVDEVRGHVEDRVFFVLTDYKGLSVEKTNELRARLSDAEADFHVVKNRLMRIVARDLELPEMDEQLAGPTALVAGDGDVVKVAKVLKDFIKENNLPVVKIGSLRGALISAADMDKLASLPSREVLLAQMVGTIAAPMSGLVGVMQQKVASLVYVLKAVQDKKENA